MTLVGWVVDFGDLGGNFEKRENFGVLGTWI